MRRTAIFLYRSALNRGLFTEKLRLSARPGGIERAYYLGGKRLPAHRVEKNKRPGGMLVYGIPSYKLEKNVWMQN